MPAGPPPSTTTSYSPWTGVRRSGSKMTFASRIARSLLPGDPSHLSWIQRQRIVYVGGGNGGLPGGDADLGEFHREVTRGIEPRHVRALMIVGDDAARVVCGGAQFEREV